MYRRCHGSRAGFTLIEALVVLIIISVIALMGFASLEKAIARGKLESSARATATLMQTARFDAIKRGGTSGVAVRYATRDLVAFSDLNGNLTYDPGTDRDLGRHDLPYGVNFWAPGDGSAGDNNALNGFYNDAGSGDDGGEIYFQSDGSVAWNLLRIEDTEEAFNGAAARFRDFRDNYLETVASPPSTARIMIRKYTGSGAANQAANWKTKDEGWTWNY